MKLKERARKLKTDIPAVFFALKKKETPLIAKLIAGIVVVYALSPIDLIPDFIPILGYLDDLIILPALIALTVKMIPEETLKICQAEAENLWQDGEMPEKITYTVNEEGKAFFYLLMQYFSSEIKPFYFEHNAFIWSIEKLEYEEGLSMMLSLQKSLLFLKDWIIGHEEKIAETNNFGIKALVKQYRMLIITMNQWIDETISDYKESNKQ